MGLCEGSARVTGTLGRSTAISTKPKRGRGSSHHVEAAVDGCVERPVQGTHVETLFFIKLILAGLPPALLIKLNLSFLIGVLAWFFRITKVVSFESVEVFRKDPFLVLYFSLH